MPVIRMVVVVVDVGRGRRPVVLRAGLDGVGSRF
jgi:hypothetical protein